MVEWLAGNRIRGTNAERVPASVAQATPTKIIDGNYTVLTYTADGKFIPKNSFNVEYLVVAGGGGGGGGIGAGGGAGGYLTNFGGTALGVTAKSYPITVGSGGSASSGTDASGGAGGNSVFDTITSTGGGYGAGEGKNGGAGGSGGGGAGANGTGGAASPSGQGFAGGSNTSNSAGAGGGGSSQVGASVSTNNGGNGGNGTSSSITGSAVTRAGGGGGSPHSAGGGSSSTGGTGGGGAGHGTTNGVNGTSNTGSGGGGGGEQGGNHNGGSGGSGIVILRFLTSGNTYDVEQVGLNLSLPSGSVGGWHEIGRTKLGSNGKTITVSGLADKRYYMLLRNNFASGAVRAGIRFGSTEIDIDTNYNNRRSNNGTGNSTNPSTNRIVGDTDVVGHDLNVEYISNKSDKEKLFIRNQVVQNTAGTGNPVNRTEMVGKWANTTNPIGTIQSVNTETGNFASDSEIVVLGWDPEDDHTTNFWKEIHSTTISANTSSFDTGTFATKKYLWIQMYNTSKSSGSNYKFRFNGTGASNEYQVRTNTNGANPTSQTSSSDYVTGAYDGILLNHDPSPSGLATGMFSNVFVINNASAEKLVMVNGVSGWTYQGAGVVPARFANAGKWSNTSTQISSIQVDGLVASGSEIKVWGSD